VEKPRRACGIWPGLPGDDMLRGAGQRSRPSAMLTGKLLQDKADAGAGNTSGRSIIWKGGAEGLQRLLPLWATNRLPRCLACIQEQCLHML